MEWRQIPSIKNYEVSNEGQVRSYRNKKILAQRKNDSGYLRVSMWINGKNDSKLVHRLVAEAFIPNTENKPQVNHKDTDKTNNHVNNLEWNTQEENMKHRTENGLSKTKAVVQYNKEGEYIAEYESMTKAEQAVDTVRKGNISLCCNGKIQSAGGFIWRWKDAD